GQVERVREGTDGGRALHRLGLRAVVGRVPGRVPRGLRDDPVLQGAAHLGHRRGHGGGAGRSRRGVHSTRRRVRGDQPIRREGAPQAVLRGDERDALLHGVRVCGEGDRRSPGGGAGAHERGGVGPAHPRARDLSDRAVVSAPAAAHRAAAGGGRLAAPQSHHRFPGAAAAVFSVGRWSEAVTGAVTGSRHRRSRYNPMRMSPTLVSWASESGPNTRSSLARTNSTRNRSAPPSTRYIPNSPPVPWRGSRRPPACPSGTAVAVSSQVQRAGTPLRQPLSRTATTPPRKPPYQTNPPRRNSESHSPENSTYHNFAPMMPPITAAKMMSAA